ncbi:MAG TPA: RagB/SusD family nutrient uptake outer membrane protein [Chitinophagaceae bacterium]|jgi:tetratricopeptide (TPR) repeat protein
MKRTFFYIAIISVLITSCNKKLDVLPQNSITPEQIQTPADVEAVLFGGYKLYQSPAAFGEQFILIPDLLASENQVNWVGTFTEYRQYQNKDQLRDNNIAENIWDSTYRIILDANTVLDKISLITDEDEKTTVTGEAEFMRGVAYFELVNLYAQPYSAGNVTSNPGVPLILSPVYEYDSTKDKPSRATVDDIYKQVLSDLTDAAAKLPEDNGTARANKYAAEAFLARVYMNMGDYENAAAMANDIISSGTYSLASPYDKAFNNDGYSPEDIFAIAQTNQSNAGTNNNGLTTFYSPQPPDGVGRGDAQVDPGYSSVFDDPDDRRGSFFTYGVGIGGSDGDYPNKWLQFYKYIPVVRLAEMYLTRGEANLRKGGTPIGGATPAEDINIVRERANASPLSGVTGTDFVEERFRELAFEGDRLWTLKRLKLDVDGNPFNDDKLVLPIPQRETDVNSNLTQNPGY